MPTNPTVTTQLIAETDFEVVYCFTGSFVDTQESAVLKVDASTLKSIIPNVTPTLSIKHAQYSCTSPGVVKIYFDATTDDLALQLGNSGQLNFRADPIPNPKSSGYTGDILFTTVGFASGGSYQIILALQKDFSTFTTAPIIDAGTTSIYDGKSGIYAVGDDFKFKVGFNQVVVSDGQPEVDITLTSGGVKAKYLGAETVSAVDCGEGTEFLTFHYTFGPSDSCQAGDFTIDDIFNVVGTKSGQLEVIDVIPSQSTTGFYVNVPTISSVTGITNGHHYVSGDSVSVTVHYSQPMIVTGSPEIKLTVDLTDREMVYASGSGTNALVFTYTPVVAGDSATAGQVTVDTSINLNSGTILNAGGVATAAQTITPPAVTTVTFN